MKKNSSNAKGILLIAFLLFAIVLGALIFRKYDTAMRGVEPAQKEAPVGSAVVTLLFASADGEHLVREGREVEIEPDTEAGVESVVDELISGPLGSLAPTLPPNVRVLGVRVNGEVAQIDFGRELKDSMPSGSSAEMVAVYSIVDTVALNFPKIKAVQFLVEGAAVQDLNGHLDLSTPLPADFSLEKKEPPVVPENKK